MVCNATLLQSLISFFAAELEGFRSAYFSYNLFGRACWEMLHIFQFLSVRKFFEFFQFLGVRKF